MEKTDEIRPPPGNEVGVLSEERLKLQQIHEADVTQNQTSWGIFPLDTIPETPKNLLSAVSKSIKQRVQGFRVLRPYFRNPSHNFSEGDLIVDLDTQKTTLVKEKGPVFRDNETRGDLILIKNGNATENVLLFTQAREAYRETRPVSDGRIEHFEIKSHFLRAATVAGKET